MGYSAMLEDGTAQYPASIAAPEERGLFLKKVYLMLFTGIATFAMAAGLPAWGFLNGDPTATAVLNAVVGIPPLLMLAIFLGVSFGVHAVSMVKGVNVIAFYLFAGFFGVLTSALLVVAFRQGGIEIITNAAALTLLVFGGLTSYVLISGKDFSFMGGFLSVGLIMLIGVVVLSLIGEAVFGFSLSGMQLAISAVSVLLFSGYVLYDTSSILYRYSTDMVVPAALALLVDFVILFRNILFLLMNARRE